MFANFEVTDEQQPCLLPFLEAFDVLLCDLHSTVPFMASYFAPKVILAFHNDADYQVKVDGCCVRMMVTCASGFFCFS